MTQSSALNSNSTSSARSSANVVSEALDLRMTTQTIIYNGLTRRKSQSGSNLTTCQMGVENEQIRVSEVVKQKIERHQREGESYNDVLERLLDQENIDNFGDNLDSGTKGDARDTDVEEGRETDSGSLEPSEPLIELQERVEKVKEELRKEGKLTQDTHINETVKQKIERHQQEGESYNDVLERILDEKNIKNVDGEQDRGAEGDAGDIDDEGGETDSGSLEKSKELKELEENFKEAKRRIERKKESTQDTHISGTVKQKIEPLQREGEGYNDVLERLLDQENIDNFGDNLDSGTEGDARDTDVEEGRETDSGSLKKSKELKELQERYEKLVRELKKEGKLKEDGSIESE